MSIQFKQATNKDSQSIKFIARRVISTNYIPFMGIEMATDFIERGMSDKEIDDNIDNCTLMLLDNSIIGFSIAQEDVLHLIMIDVPYQKKGYGGLLLSYMEKNIFNQYETIRLQTFQENKDTVQFYLNKGWLISGKEYMPEFDKTMLSFKKLIIE